VVFVFIDSQKNHNFNPSQRLLFSSSSSNWINYHRSLAAAAAKGTIYISM